MAVSGVRKSAWLEHSLGLRAETGSQGGEGARGSPTVSLRSLKSGGTSIVR